MSRAGVRPAVTIVERGREGQVVYREGAQAIAGYQEFGGGDVVAVVSMGTVQDWRTRHPWALERRAQILRFVADEVVRQKAPACSAEIDEARGDIVLRAAASRSGSGSSSGSAGAGYGAGRASRGAPAGAPSGVSILSRQAGLRGKLGAALLAAVLLLAAGAWFMGKVLAIDPGRGTPLGSTVRTETHLATLIQTLQPYVPSLHRDPSKDRYTLGVFLVPLDGSAPRLFRLPGELRPGSYSLAKVIGSDGRTLWVSANGLFGIDLQRQAVVGADDVRRANPGLAAAWTEDTRGMEIVNGRLRLLARDRSAAFALDPATWKAQPVEPRPTNRLPFEPALTRTMAAGSVTAPGAWLGLHSAADLAGAYQPGRRVRAVESARDAKEMRRLVRGVLDATASDTGSRQIRAMAPVGETEYLNAFFLRVHEKAEPLRVPQPESVLMLHTSAAGLAGTLVVARVDITGRVLWSADTALDRFKLQQILPGERATAFVGTRVPVPGKVSEPLLVIVEHASGRLTTHSLWQ